MVPNGPEALLVGSRTVYGRDLDAYARLEYPRDNLYWIQTAAVRRRAPLLPVGRSRRTPGGVRRAFARMVRLFGFAGERPSARARDIAVAP
jgi:hypothetical protein